MSKAGLVCSATMGLVFAFAASEASAAVTPQQAARMDGVARYAVVQSFCVKIGFQVDESAASAAYDALVNDPRFVGMTRAELDATFDSSIQRVGAVFSRDSKAAASKAGSLDARPVIEAFFRRIDAVCLEASTDPVFSRAFKAASPEVRGATRTALVGDLMAKGGQASWQTPVMRARADLLYITGACSARLPRQDVERYSALVDKAATEKERAYYSDSLRDGLDAASELGFDDGQCRRLTATYSAAVTF
ncbi:hypothetical protein QO010_000949 [Caulobacter ginsengisoli]|uniref:DUF2059 domain-containing protein n=1 Tax=Caulobacter ginsengisoli TaxID=400775 RepID=A0ABU0IP81_9CAUL|nr:hypothetical protein [Caulobacter ginsengisoli]MDQ0463201.1 hypothetical protein [Caulobacter ginsengisoli]